MKMSFFFMVLFFAFTGHAESESILSKYYGTESEGLNEKTLKSHQSTFCAAAPEVIAKSYGQVVLTQFDCEKGKVQIRIKDGQRFFLVTKIKSYTGDRELDLVTTLTEKNGTDFFGSITVLGLDGE